MRQLKTFMRNRKKEMLACGPCECRTLQCWRYANENCGCGESNLPNYVRVEEDEIGVYWAHFFNDSGRDNTISIETDYEAGGIKTVVGEFPIIKDEDTRGLWYQVWDNIDAEVVEKLFGMDKGKEGVGQFTPEAMAQFNALINNPTEEQAQILREWLEDKASDGQLIVVFDLPTLNNVIESTGDRSADTLTDGGENYIGVGIETDAETGKPKLGTYASGVFADERYTIQGTNFWEDLFKSMEIEKVQSMIDNVTEFPENIFTAMNTYYINPTLENAQSLRNLLSSRNPGR